MLTRVREKLRRFAGEKTGLAAVEFAFVMPVMLSFFLGLYEAGQALSCRANVTSIASIGADLIAQESTVTDSDLSNVYGALAAMLFPFDSTKATVTIYSIVDNGTASGKVAWSCTLTSSGNTSGPTSIPTGSTGGTMIADSNLNASGQPTYGGGGSVIMAYVTYTYSSSVSSVFIPQMTWTNSFYEKPRNVAQITLSGGIC